MAAPYSVYLKKAWLFFFVLISTFALGQPQTEIDSIFKVLERPAKNDSVRVELLLKAARISTYSNTEKAIMLSKEAMQVSNHLNLISGKFKSYLYLGMAHYRGKAYANALEEFYKALKIADSINNNTYQSMVYGNIANVYADLGKFEEAMENYHLFLGVANKLNNPEWQVQALSNIGILKTDKTALIDDGIENLKEALKIAHEKGMKRYISNITLNLGLAYKRKNDLKNALLYYDKARHQGQEIDDKYTQLLALNNLSTINFDRNKLDHAETYAKKTIKMAQELEDVEWQANGWQVLSEVYESKNDKPQAYDAYKNFVVLNDSLKAINNKDEIAKIEEQYKFEKQKLQIEAKHEKELVISNQALLREKLIKKVFSIIAILIIILIIVGFLYLKRKREAQFNLKVSNTELKALKAQINPHFVFNSLNSISNFISNKDTVAANNYLIKFSKLMRQTLENSEKDEITIKEDIDHLISYLEIEKKRFANGFDYSINIESSLENALIPPMMLQPFVENSIWHGISQLKKQGLILIEAKKENNMVLYIIDDNGIGRNKSKNQRHPNKTSFGIKITKDRIDIINQRKKTNASLRIIDKEQGTRVEMRLPLAKHFEHD